MTAKLSSLRPLRLKIPIKSSLKTSLALRAYHSHDHPPPPRPFSQTESLILSASVPHIPTHGFTDRTLALGAKDSGYIDASVNLFERGPFNLVLWYLHTQRISLAAKCKGVFKMEEGKKEMGVGSKVKALTWERLMSNQSIISRWQEALALMALPLNIPPSLSELHALSDEIWYLAGDVTVDGSWYTKRASLSAIYAASELFMTTDQSMEFRDTREFMERRFKDVQVVGDAVGGLGQWAAFTTSAAVNVLRSKGVRI